MKTISSADANRYFSAVLRDVSQGEEIIVVSRGTAVARIVSINSNDQSRRAAHSALLTRLKAQKPTGERNWTRADLYEA